MKKAVLRRLLEERKNKTKSEEKPVKNDEKHLKKGVKKKEDK